MDTKMTTTTTTTTTTITTTTTTTTLTATSSGSKGVKRHREEDDKKDEEKDEIDIAMEKDERCSDKEEKKAAPPVLLSRLKDCRADEAAPDADAKHPIVVALRELIAGGDCERVRRFIYSNPRTLRLRLVERAAHIINEMLWGEYLKTNLYGIDNLDHAKPFEGLHLTPEVFRAVNEGLYVDEDSESDTDSKSGGESKAPLEDEDGDEEEDDDDDTDTDPDSPRAMDTNSGSDSQEDEEEGEGDEEEEDSDLSSSDSESDNETLLDKQARQERRAKEQDHEAKRAEAYQDTKAQEAAEVKDDGEGDISRPDRLSDFDAPLLRDSAHYTNPRIMDRVILPWCHRVSTTGGPLSRLLAMLKLLCDIKEQYCDGFTSPHQVKVARTEALHAQAHGEDPAKSEQMRCFYLDWVGNEHAAGGMHEACADGLKLVKHSVKSYRKAAADSDRKDALRLELGQLCDQVLKPVDTLLCILREATRFETQSRKLPLEISLLETESKLLAESTQAILPVEYEAYAPILGSTRTELLHCLNPVRFPDRETATAYLNSLGIGTDKIQEPGRLCSKSLAFVLALGRANLEETYHRDPSIVSTFHYADYGCVISLLDKRREWMKSLASVRTLRMNERTLRTMCDNYNTGNQHSGLVPLEFKWVYAPDCEERLAPVISSLSDTANFVRALFEAIERNKRADHCCHEIDGCSDYLLNPLANALNEDTRQTIKDYIANSDATKWREAADKREQKERNEKEDGEYDSDPDEFTTVRSRTARDFVSEFPDSFELAERTTDADAEDVTQPDDLVPNAPDVKRNERALKRRRRRDALAATSDQDTESDEDMPAALVSEDADGDVEMS